MYRFVASTPGAPSEKRKQAQRACGSCRKRKKRCVHFDGSTVAAEPSAAPGKQGSPSRAWNTGTALSRSSSAEATSNQLSEAAAQQSPEEALASQLNLRLESDRSPHAHDCEDDSHFVGDLNPEGTFLAAATNPQANASVAADKVGVWLTGGNNREVGAVQPKWSNPFSPKPLIAKLLLPNIYEQCIRLLPEDFPALSRIYFDEIDAYFPVVDVVRFNALQDMSPAKVLLKQAICLAASTQIAARPYLKFAQAADHPASPREFAERITAAIRTVLDMELVKDRRVRIQVFTLLSLFTQFWDDRHLSADVCARAIALLQTVGLHLHPSVTDSTAEHLAYRNRLLICVWTLDRLNAGFHGRPVMMHERDFGQNLETIIKEQDNPFRLILRTLLVFDKVIALYRPDSSANHREWEGQFPSFEQLVRESGAFDATSKQLATIEILYHAVAMLSCRSQSPQEPPRSSPSSVIQSLSAVQITTMASDGLQNRVVLLPFVPYSISLALRVAYREMRQSKVPMLQARARNQLLSNCSALREVGESYWSAVRMAELAEKTVDEMDRAATSMVHARSRRASDTGVNEAPSVDTSNAPSHPNLPYSDQSQHDEGGPLNFSDFATDSSLFNQIPDFDIFQHLDPSFDLNAVDLALANDWELYQSEFDTFLPEA